MKRTRRVQKEVSNHKKPKTAHREQLIVNHRSTHAQKYWLVHWLKTSEYYMFRHVVLAVALLWQLLC